MLLSFKYKLRPNQQQSQKLIQWLDMLRANYNWCLRDRIDGWHQQFICGDYCDLRTQVEITPLTCGITKGTQLANPWKEGGGKAQKEGDKDKSPKRSASLMQDANLQELKEARPWYQSIDLGVLQSIPARVNESFNKFFKGAGFRSLSAVTISNRLATNQEESRLKVTKFTSLKLGGCVSTTLALSPKDLRLKP